MKTYSEYINEKNEDDIEDPIKKDSSEEIKNDEIEADDIEDEEIDLLPYDEKIKMLITMLSEYGFSNYDISLEGHENIIKIDGKIDNKIINNVTKLMDDMKLTIKTEIKKISKDNYQTIFMVSNNMEYQTFRDIWKLMKQREKEKQEMELGLQEPM